MKITAQEEYGLRILLTIARDAGPEGLTIPQISRAQGLSQHYVGKLSRILRLAGFIRSTRGKEGGYLLNQSANQIFLKNILDVLGGRLYEPEYCYQHTGLVEICPNSIDCSVRSVWRNVQQAVDHALSNITLQDLIRPETEFSTTHFHINEN
jgi:Rrf2 family iron-sulfur cluster assembly transcriptional regulator